MVNQPKIIPEKVHHSYLEVIAVASLAYVCDPFHGPHLVESFLVSVGRDNGDTVLGL